MTTVASAGKKKKKEKIPAPGAKGETTTSFYTRKKWKSVMQFSLLELAGRQLNARGTLIVGTALQKNRYVTKLDLSNNALGNDGAIVMADVLRTNALIYELNLAHNGIGDIGGIALASAFIPNVSPNGQPGLWNRTLLTLILMGNELGDDTLLALSNAAACHHDLTRVDLSWNRVGPQGTKCLLRCFQRNPLCGFSLAANLLADEGTAHLCEALGRYGGKSQTTVNLFRNDVSHRGAEAVGRLLAGNDTVMEVNLSGNSLGFRGAEQLRRTLVPSTPPLALRTLILADNLIGDEGAAEIAQIIAANWPTLERLDVAYNRITDKGATAMMQALLAHNTTLQLVNCKGNVFGPRAVAVVEEIVKTTKSMKSLNLTHCVESPEHRRVLSMLLGEYDTVHVELGPAPRDLALDADDENNLLNKVAEHALVLADQEAQLKAAAAAKKSSKKKKKKS